MFVTHLEFTALDLFPDYQPPGDPQDNDFTYTYSYYDYLTNSERTDAFTFSCSVFYIVGSQSNSSSNQVNYWENNNNYYNAWEQTYNSTVANLLEEAAGTSTVQSLCKESHENPLATASDGNHFQILTIDIPEGYAIEYIQYNGLHTYSGCSSALIAPRCYYHYNVGGPQYSWGESSQGYPWNLSEGPSLYDTAL